MGIFDLFRNIGQGIMEEVERANTHVEQTRSTSEETKTGSAIPSGRMKHSSTVKGKDCIIPNTPGVYRHVDKETGEIGYVGQTNNLKKRQQQHALSGKLNLDTHNIHFSAARANADRDDLCETEKKHIKKHKPSENKTAGGNGRR